MNLFLLLMGCFFGNTSATQFLPMQIPETYSEKQLSGDMSIVPNKENSDLTDEEKLKNYYQFMSGFFGVRKK